MSSGGLPIPKGVPKKGFLRSQHRIGLPFPNYGLGPTELPVLCRCIVDDKNNFYVTHEMDMLTLYRNVSPSCLDFMACLSNLEHHKPYHNIP
jgi:hypothetical protein